MANGFEFIISEAAQKGFFTYLIPWALLFTLSYYSASNIWDDNNAIPLVVAGSFSSLLLYFLYLNPAYRLFFTQYSGTLTFVVAGVAGFLLLLGSVGIDTIPGGGSGTIFLLFSVAAAAFLISGGTQPFGQASTPSIGNIGLGAAISNFLFEQDGWIIVIPLSIVVAVVLSSISDDEGNGPGGILGQAMREALVED